MKNKSLLTISGFLIFVTGIVSVMLTLVGLRLSFLKPLYAFGDATAFIIQLLMIFFGLILVYVAQTNQETS